MNDYDTLSRCDLLLIFGGTFDPPHVAHVRLPVLAARQVNADRVVYLPAALSPFKTGEHVTPAEHRLVMLQLALQDEPKAQIVTLELDADASGAGPSYTIDTLHALRARLGDRPRLRLLIGGDQLRAFDRWKDHQQIIQLAEPLVMVRPPDTRQSLLDALPEGFDRQAWSKRFVDLPVINVSSTDIRNAADLAARDDLPPKVHDYITSHRLYQC